MDLISRQEAIQQLHQSYNLFDAERRLEDMPSAQPEQEREFIKLTVRDSNGRSYYSIVYLEVDKNGVGQGFEGYSSYDLDVISDYLKRYFGFGTSAQPDKCVDCMATTKMFQISTRHSSDEKAVEAWNRREGEQNV